MVESLLHPEAERRDPGEMLEVPVGTQQDKLVPDAKLGEKRIDRADLQPPAATIIAKVRRGDVIVSLWHDQRQSSESIQDLLSRLGAAESLQDLLENQARCEDRFFVLKSIRQEAHAGMAVTLVTAQGKRPDTGIDEQLQFRDRAAL